MARKGRPTTYSKEILTRSTEYLQSCADDYLVRGSRNRRTYHLRVKLPTIEGLARHLRVNRDTIYAWAVAHPDFSDILDDIRAEQADKLINNGLSGDYNSTITKLMLSKHGYSDKIESDITSGGEPITTLTDGERAALRDLRAILFKRAA